MKNLFKTAGNNRYLYQPQENKVMFLHPLIDFFSEMEDSGTNAVEWIDKLEETNIEIEGVGVFSPGEIRYYFKKYGLLKGKIHTGTDRTNRQFQRRLSGHDIENLIVRCKEVIFQVTNTCQMRCRYCSQGDLYRVHEKNQKPDIDRNKAKLLLKYLGGYWGRPLAPGRIGIKFYGGEPLLNFAAIEEIVSYAKSLPGVSEKFYYYITTNGVLLDRYMDYLAANDFRIAVSLDGDRDHDRHRIFKNGKPSFEKVTANIERLRDKYPSYFEKNVTFQAVLHNFNSITGIGEYFKKTYDKRPFMTEMTRVEVNKDREKEFTGMYKSTYDSLYHGEDYPLLEEKKLKELPITPGTRIIAHEAYELLLKDMDEPGKTGENMTPTGTCHPFSKSIFMTTDGRILPCERIKHKYALGYIDDEVKLDFKAIADKYNRLYDNMNRLCCSCFNSTHCRKCMFYCKVEESTPECNRYSGQKEFLQKLSDSIGYLEEKPGIYFKHITELKE